MSDRAFGYVNVYSCTRCGHRTITIDRDEGTTPFLIPCQSGPCREWAQSAFYRVPEDLGAHATHEFYRPDGFERAGLNSAEADHVSRGGLLMRRIDPVNPPDIRPKPDPLKMRSLFARDKAAGEALREERRQRKAEAWAKRQPKQTEPPGGGA